MKRILILANSASGLYDFRNELLLRLLKEGYEVHISLPDEDKIPELVTEGCKVYHTPLDRRGMNPVRDMKLMRAYDRLLAQIKPDVVLTYTIKPNIYGNLCCRRRHIPYLVNITGLGSVFENGGMVQKLVVFLYKMALKSASCIFFQNETNREIFEKYGIRGKKSRLVSGSGVNLERHRAEEYPAQTQPVRFLYVGRLMKEKGIEELLYAARAMKQEYPDVDYFDEEDLAESMQDVYQQTGCQFVIIIDEWDCIFREYKSDKEAQEQYLDFLRDFLKDKSYIHLAYMTGILPVKKYGTHSALNMFDEFSMIYAGPLAKFVGFTETEVRELCEKYHMDMREIREWYDGYRFENCEPVYNPRSVVNGMLFGSIRNYWNMTESFEALQTYIDMNFEGLKDDILSMLAGEHIPVNTGNFTNDMTTFRDENDVLTLLIHLGYLAYDSTEHCVYIPNNEIRNEYANAVSVSDWGEVSKALKNSADVLNAIWNQNEQMVAQGIQRAHFESQRTP